MYSAAVLLLVDVYKRQALTMSGIAGMVLSLGMAVDANVLIYERTKEELRAGKTVKAALEDGYSNACSAIFDSNLTSIITVIILFYFGTGPIRGFATTLIIGIWSWRVRIKILWRLQQTPEDLLLWGILQKNYQMCIRDSI